ncbi:MAG: TfoX/Sxy family protein [Acidovorax sp.]|uniref:TfoX/Sxy family protein n=1 Tax=Acidovorax sp. TaxID=1872122 RepID=UPI00262822C3|nr:TfoX/Sxy family protein [Acidovorax sp.]MDH4424920.1 TfoX/Sxy family protein [Acidovorax sp.]
MPARPLSDETLHLIDAVRAALAHRADVDERTMFGCWCFFVDGKLCIGVKGGDLLVRLPPGRHAEFQEMQNTRELSPGGGMQGYFWVEPNGYATREQWASWMSEALAYNPLAKASPRRRKPVRQQGSTAPPARSGPVTSRHAPGTAGTPLRQRHSIFEDDS